MTSGTRKGRETTCSTCGEPTLSVQLPYLSTPIQLNDHDLPITADLAALVTDFQVWEYAGPRVGWIEKYTDQRTWRPLRARHHCPPQLIDVRSLDRGFGKHENKKENTR